MHATTPPALVRRPSRPRLTSARLFAVVLSVVAWCWWGTGAGAAELPVTAAELPVTAAEAGQVPVGSGLWPLTPRPPVVRGFEPPVTAWSPGHRGADLGGGPVQTVRAALAGRVTFAGRIAGRGVVVVDHGDLRTTYEPVSPTVHRGDLVSAGATIGQLELFGSHCFPAWCLHWGLIEGHDHYLDPLVLVGAAPVILLPLGSAPGVGPGVGPVLGPVLGPDAGPGSGARLAPVLPSQGGPTLVGLP